MNAVNDRLKYIFRIISSCIVALGGIGWIAVFLIDTFINKTAVTPGAVIIPVLGLCLAGIGILLLIYTISEHKNHKNSSNDSSDASR